MVALVGVSKDRGEGISSRSIMQRRPFRKGPARMVVMEDRTNGVVVGGLTMSMKAHTYIDIVVNGEMVRIFFSKGRKIIIQGDREKVKVGLRTPIPRAA